MKDEVASNIIPQKRRKSEEHLHEDGLNKKKPRMFSIKEFRKQLNSSEKLNAIKEFLSAIINSSGHDYVYDYLKNGGNCLELLQCLESDSTIPPTLVFDLVTQLLLRINASYRQYYSSAHESCRYLINNYLPLVHKMLGLSSSKYERKVIILSLARKISSSCFAIKLSAGELGADIGKSVYFAPIEPRLRYGIAFWDATSNQIFNSLFVIQNRAVRYICNVSPRTSCLDDSLSEEDITSGSEYSPDINEQNTSDSSGESFNGREEKMLELDDVLQQIPNLPNHVTAEADSAADQIETLDQVFVTRKENLKKKIFQVQEKVSRKRPKEPNQWKKTKSAIAREKGQEYHSQKTGKLVPKKEIAPELLCKNKCRLKCSKKFNLEARKSILEKYYSLDINSKNALLFKSIDIQPVTRHRKDTNNPKTYSFTYSVTFNKKSEKICKDALCSLYQFSRKKIEVIQNKLKKGQCAPTPDKRGHHYNRPHKVTDDVITCVINHIKSFPAEESHYSRNKNFHKKYLSPLLNISQMYKLYIKECTDKNLVERFMIKLSSYTKIFSTRFNLSFGHPKSDTCGICDAGQNTEEHTENYKRAFESQKRDRKKPSLNHKTCYITMDLQQTMPLPKLSTSKAFYLRQMWLYNFGVQCITSTESKPYFFNWTEDVANRGSLEIVSCMYRFCQLLKETHKDVSHLIIWSDSCAGQNKNFNMVCLYQLLIFTGTFDVIEHKFPEVGHSYLDSDRNFGRIEKQMRKHENIYVPEQYYEIIKSASKKNCSNINMENYFYNFEEVSGHLHLFNKKTNLLGQKVYFRDHVKWIRVEEFGSYFYKENLDEFSPFHKVELYKKGKRILNKVQDKIVLNRVKEKRGGLTSEKLDNLREQLIYVKEEYQWFYQNILTENENKPKKKRKTN